MAILTPSQIEAMKNVDIRTVDPTTLVDINDIKINTELSKQERLLDFINQIKNPYCYKCGDTIIKVTFAENEVSIEDLLEHYFKSI